MECLSCLDCGDDEKYIIFFSILFVFVFYFISFYYMKEQQRIETLYRVTNILHGPVWSIPSMYMHENISGRSFLPRKQRAVSRGWSRWLGGPEFLEATDLFRVTTRPLFLFYLPSYIPWFFFFCTLCYRRCRCRRRKRDFACWRNAVMSLNNGKASRRHTHDEQIHTINWFELTEIEYIIKHYK